MRSGILSVNVWSRNLRHAALFSPIHSTTKFCTAKSNAEQDKKFETVFSFPLVRHIATLNKMKIYHMISATIAVPACGLLEALGTLPESTFLATSYIGVTGGILLSLASLPFSNTIGFLYVSEDNKFVKVSIVNFWGQRKDRVVSIDDWIPLLDMKPNAMDAIYLSPQLADGTKYKLFVKFGKVLNSTKMVNVLE